MTAETLAVLHPKKHLVYRAIEAVGTVPVDFGSQNPKELVGATVGFELLCDLDLAKLKPKKRGVLFSFFDATFVINNNTDALVCRTQEGRKSLVWVENFFLLGEKVHALQDRAKKEWPDSDVPATMEKWFVANRILNFASRYIANGSKIDWGEYKIPEEKEWKDWNDRNLEMKMLSKISTLFKNWEEKDPVSNAILFRALTAVAYIHPLANMLSDGKESVKDVVRRVSPAIMACQMCDDFTSPEKDWNFQIAGIVGTALKSGQRHNPITSPSPDTEETETAVSLARDVIGGCLSLIDPDSRYPAKKLLAKIGLLGAATAYYIGMDKKEGRTEYPTIPLLGSVVKNLLVKTEPGKYRQVTIDAIRNSLSALI